MFPKQSWVALLHALQISSMPFSTVIGLVLFGMLTAPPSQQKPPETVSEMFSAAESKTLRGKYEQALALYNQIIAKSPESLVLASAYWGRGATYFKQFTRVNTRVRTLKLIPRSDRSSVGYGFRFIVGSLDDNGQVTSYIWRALIGFSSVF